MIWIWDEISGECKATSPENPGEESWDPETADAMNDPNEWDSRPTWEMQYVIDTPDGIRVVIEQDHRGHNAVWVTTPDD